MRSIGVQTLSGEATNTMQHTTNTMSAELQHAQQHTSTVTERAAALERALRSQSHDAQAYLTEQLRQHHKTTGLLSAQVVQAQADAHRAYTAARHHELKSEQ